MEVRQAADGNARKRKADSVDSNERLSKRLSLLNLERNGQKLYVPVEHPSEIPSCETAAKGSTNDEIMQMDDTKHKVYIYNLDDELSDSDSSVDENQLVFLSNIEKHLHDTRIPASVLANRDGELAGQNLNNELILYGVPNSLTLAEDKDSVRKAIIESRARLQEKQRREREIARTSLNPGVGSTSAQPPRPTMHRANGTIEIPKAESIRGDDPDAMDLS